MGELIPEQRKGVIEEFEEAAVARNVISLGGLEAPKTCSASPSARKRPPS